MYGSRPIHPLGCCVICNLNQRFDSPFGVLFCFVCFDSLVSPLRFVSWGVALYWFCIGSMPRNPRSIRQLGYYSVLFASIPRYPRFDSPGRVSCYMFCVAPMPQNPYFHSPVGLLVRLFCIDSIGSPLRFASWGVGLLVLYCSNATESVLRFASWGIDMVCFALILYNPRSDSSARVLRYIDFVLLRCKETCVRFARSGVDPFCFVSMP